MLDHKDVMWGEDEDNDSRGLIGVVRSTFYVVREVGLVRNPALKRYF